MIDSFIHSIHSFAIDRHSFGATVFLKLVNFYDFARLKHLTTLGTCYKSLRKPKNKCVVYYFLHPPCSILFYTTHYSLSCTHPQANAQQMHSKCNTKRSANQPMLFLERFSKKKENKCCSCVTTSRESSNRERN